MKFYFSLIAAMLAFCVSQAKTDSVQSEKVKLDWSTLKCKMYSSNGQKNYLIKGVDGLWYKVADPNWDCLAAAPSLHFDVKQCVCHKPVTVGGGGGEHDHPFSVCKGGSNCGGVTSGGGTTAGATNGGGTTAGTTAGATNGGGTTEGATTGTTNGGGTTAGTTAGATNGGGTTEGATTGTTNGGGTTAGTTAGTTNGGGTTAGTTAGATSGGSQTGGALNSDL